MLVSAYLYNHDEDDLKTIVQTYINGNYPSARFKLDMFLSEIGWQSNRIYSNDLFDAKKIIMQSGMTDLNNDYTDLTLKEIIRKNAFNGSFKMNDIVNGYIRLANHQNRKIDIESITYYLPLYYEHKDYSVIGLSEIFYQLIIREKVTLKYAFDTINTFQKMSDKGIGNLFSELVNLLGTNYINEMEELGVVAICSDYRVWITSLSVDVVNAVNERYVKAAIRQIINNELGRQHRYKESASLNANEYTVILESKYSNYFKEELNTNLIELIYEPPTLSSSKLANIAEKVNKHIYDKNENLDRGIVKETEKDYYMQIGLDYLTFAQCYGGSYEKIPYLNFLNLYDKGDLKNNIEKILQYMIAKSFVGMQFDDDRIENKSDRGLISGIPHLLEYIFMDFDWNIIKVSLIKMIDVSFGKI